MRRAVQLFNMFSEKGESTTDAFIMMLEWIQWQVVGGAVCLHDPKTLFDGAATTLSVSLTDGTIEKGWECPVAAAMGSLHEGITDIIQTQSVKVKVFVTFETEDEGTICRETKPIPQPMIGDIYSAVNELVGTHRDNDDHYEGNVKGVKGVSIISTSWSPFGGGVKKKIPSSLQNKHCVVNVENVDERCFVWAVLSVLYPVDTDAQRVSKYEQHIGYMNLEGFDWPFSTSNISKFIKKNQGILAGRDIDVYETGDVAGKSGSAG